MAVTSRLLPSASATPAVCSEGGWGRPWGWGRLWSPPPLFWGGQSWEEGPEAPRGNVLPLGEWGGSGESDQPVSKSWPPLLLTLWSCFLEPQGSHLKDGLLVHTVVRTTDTHIWSGPMAKKEPDSFRFKSKLYHSFNCNAK